MTAAVLATAVLAAVLLAVHIGARRTRAERARVRQARLDDRIAGIRADRQRVLDDLDETRRQRDSLAVQVDVEATGRRRAEFLAETYLAAWRRETRERRALTDRLAALAAPAPVVVDEVGRRRDAKGRWVAAQRAAGEAGR